MFSAQFACWPWETIKVDNEAYSAFNIGNL